MHTAAHGRYLFYVENRQLCRRDLALGTIKTAANHWDPETSYFGTCGDYVVVLEGAKLWAVHAETLESLKHYSYTWTGPIVGEHQGKVLVFFKRTLYLFDILGYDGAEVIEDHRRGTPLLIREEGAPFPGVGGW